MNYGVIRSIASSLGVDIRRKKRLGSLHSEILPEATLSPWLCDVEFKRINRLIKGHTLVDTYRLYDLWALVQEVQTIDGDILEVGVWRGGTGVLLGTRAARLSLKATVFLCDTFSGVVKAGREDNQYAGGEHADTSLDLVVKLAQKVGLSNTQVLKGIFPDDTGDELTDHIFRLCHIDVDVKQSADDILSWVWPRLARGGVIVYDDYGFQACDGIRQHVDDQRGRPDRLVVHNLNGHAVVFKR